ncbi:hypothetical protein G9P44_000845 [Scheffersomyces stipitis]|nr:hypothetical protein G9P44_000845 [Scheffersomyces stipitis]
MLIQFTTRSLLSSLNAKATFIFTLVSLPSTFLSPYRPVQAFATTLMQPFSDLIEQLQIIVTNFLQDLRSSPERAEYTFDRYFIHSPFCVLRKLNPNSQKVTYQFKGIPLGKYDTFEDYLVAKEVTSLASASSESYSTPNVTVSQEATDPPLQHVAFEEPLKFESPSLKPSCPLVPLPQAVNVEVPAATKKVPIAPASPLQQKYPYISGPRLKKEPKIARNNVLQRRQTSTPQTQALQVKGAKTGGPVKYINIQLPNNKKSKVVLKMVPKTKVDYGAPPSGLVSHRINKSIDPNEDQEYIDLVIKAIQEVFPTPGYDDGSLAPIILRLAWHCCATYDISTGNGGSNGATMRFVPEITDEGNTGLDISRAALEPVKQKFPRISYSDLWTLAGKVAIESMGGPEIPWTAGRVDCRDDRHVPSNGHLPFADKDAGHIRSTFQRMGFGDQEAVILLGAHSLGRCHKRFSGWEGKWTTNPIQFSNDFYKVLVNENWQKGTVPETGREQYFNDDKSLMMLNTDMELLRDPEYLRWVIVYSRDEQAYFRDFAATFGKLLELGISRDINGQVLPKAEFFYNEK